MALDIKRLRTDFAAAAKDGKISDTEVDGLLRRARRDGLRESEAKSLKTETARYKDQFTPDAWSKISTFIDSKLRPLRVLDDPTPVDPLGVKDPAVLPAGVKRVRQEIIPGGHVQLRNPWGDSEPASYGRDDGSFKMELGEFTKMYANVEINGG
jgi:hypothetical protein